MDQTVLPLPRPTGVRRVLLDSGYSLSAFFLAIPALVLVAVGLGLGVGLPVLLAGFFVLTARAYDARGFAHAERFRLRSIQGYAAPTPA